MMYFALEFRISVLAQNPDAHSPAHPENSQRMRVLCRFKQTAYPLPRLETSSVCKELMDAQAKHISKDMVPGPASERIYQVDI